MSNVAQLIPCLLMVSACGSSQVSNAAEAALSDPNRHSSESSEPFELGVNVSSINWWDGNRPFMNLIYGSSWQFQDMSPARHTEEVPSTSLDANGWVKAIPAGYRVIRELSVPLAGGEFACRYSGEGKLIVEGSAVSDMTTSRGITRFRLRPTYPDARSAMLSYRPTSANYIRDVDCREVKADRSAVLAPQFVLAVRGFKVLRFLNWQTATSENTPISWASRNKPGDADYLKRDGVPLELIVDTANQAGADAWVTMPWNADEDYVRRFATYMRDHLAPGRRVYVEVSNEVWNGAYAVSAQACNEAKAEGLPGVNGGIGCSLERYAEKTKQVMQIWSAVFAGQMNRLVRVASFNHRATYYSDAILRYDDLHQSVDALATAPYFGYDLTDSFGFDRIMAALPAKVDETVTLGVRQKTIARKYGLRYVTYEGGQHIIFPNNVPLLKQVERDPRMYTVYQHFLADWRDQIGDDLNLYALVGSISRYGGWGLTEYVGQPLAEVPKLHAVRDFMRLTKGTTAGVTLREKLHQNWSLLRTGMSVSAIRRSLTGIAAPASNSFQRSHTGH